MSHTLFQNISKKMLAEFIGTFAIVYCGVGAIALTQTGLLNAGLVGIAFGHGFAVIAMIYALGSISGAHFNPAVSIALTLAKRLPLALLLPYIAAQLLGSLGAVALLSLTHGEALSKVSFGATLLANSVSPLSGLATEIILTFLLVLVIFRVAVQENNKSAGFVIGLTVMMAISASGPLTGVALNPARAFGPALFLGNWNNHWVFWVGPIVGGILAASAAQFLQPSREISETPPLEGSKKGVQA